MAPKKAAKAKSGPAAPYEDLAVGALADNINDEFSIEVTEAIRVVLNDSEFEGIERAAPIGISREAGVSTALAGSQAWKQSK